MWKVWANCEALDKHCSSCTISLAPWALSYKDNIAFPLGSPSLFTLGDQLPHFKDTQSVYRGEAKAASLNLVSGPCWRLSSSSKYKTSSMQLQKLLLGISILIWCSRVPELSEVIFAVILYCVICSISVGTSTLPHFLIWIPEVLSLSPPLYDPQVCIGIILSMVHISRFL